MMTQDAIAFPADLPVPVLWCFKHRLPGGRVMDLTLRRVKPGNETAVECVHDGPNHVSGLGRFSDAATLLARFDDPALREHAPGWAAEAVRRTLEQAAEVCRYQPALWRLFTPKGKIELYTPEARHFEAQYIPSNYTLKWHADALAEQPGLLLHALAQHLDYPFQPGERRFSTSRLFDLCFAAEKVIAPKGLAARIDETLEARGLFQPPRHEERDYDHVADLLHDKPAAIRNSYERVLQRERFAALIAAFYGHGMRGLSAPVLQHYRHYIELDLAIHAQQDFTAYPTKARDDLAEAMHVPLAMMFTTRGHDGRTEQRMG